MKRGVQEVSNQKPRLFVKRFADVCWGVNVGLDRHRRQPEFHRGLGFARFFTAGGFFTWLWRKVGSSRVDLQACKLEYSIVSPK